MSGMGIAVVEECEFAMNRGHDHNVSILILKLVIDGGL